MFNFSAKSEFTRNVITLFSGSILSQLIPFIALPILQKYFYSPSDFGELAVFVSFCGLLSGISCLKLEFGIVLKNRLKDAINLSVAALGIALTFSLLVLILIILFKGWIISYLGNPFLANLLYLVPVYILLVGLNDILSYWNNRKKKFNIISISKIFQTSSAESSKIIFGYMGHSVSGLIIGRIVGFFISAFYYGYLFLKRDFKVLKLVRTRHVFNQISRNKEYIYFTTPSVFVGNLINFTFINLFLIHFGKDVVGVIGISMTYIAAGFGVLSISFSQVFFSKIAEIKTKDILLRLYKRFAWRLFLISMVPIILIYVIPNKFIIYLLGDEWGSLLEIARIMVIWLSVWFVSSSLSFIYMRLRKQKIMLLFDILHLGLIYLGFHTAYYFSPTLEWALWGITIVRVAVYSAAIFMAIGFIKRCDESKL
jgi:lipopolysaccharide exporter